MKYLPLFLLLCVLSCTQEETLPALPADEGGISLSVAPPEQRGASARALFPLGPETENPIKSIALLVFDQESQHLIGNSMYYYYENIVAEDAPDGKLNVQIPPYPFDPGNVLPDLNQEVTLCAVANINEDALLAAMRQKAGAGSVINLAQFKEITVKLPYYEKQDSVGLVKNIYMFGYYKGKLRPEESTHQHISISLGRIITRLNLALSVSEELDNTGMRCAIRLKNTSRDAYIFPGLYSPKETYTDEYFYPIDKEKLKPGTPATFYYYVGPHYAVSEEEATQMEIAYGTDIPTTPFTASGYTGNHTSVAICNDPPSVTTEDRDFRINRNSIYHISIHLKKKGEKSPATVRHSLSSATCEIEIDSARISK